MTSMSFTTKKLCVLGLCTFGFLFSVNGQEPKPRFPMPKAKYNVRIEKSVMIPMRDGVKLSTDLYFPEGAGEKLPVILVRTPYNKNVPGSDGDTPSDLVGQDYVVAVQDVRGKFESEGDYIVSAADTNDGYDTVEWLASQSWSTGKVGTTGCSYPGENQVQMAKLRNPHHVAMNPRAASGGMQYFGFLRGGAFELAGSANWFLRNGSKVKPQIDASMPRSQFLAVTKYFTLNPSPPKVDWPELWRSLPLRDMMDKAGMPATDWEGFVSHPEGDPWWDQFGYVKETDHFDTPGLFLDSWYDYGVGDTFKLVELIKKNSASPRARENQFIVIAPTLHCWYEDATERTVVGTRDLGDAQFDYYGLYLRWFDYWLRGIDNGVTKMPKIQLYVMGRNEWRGENEWPLARTKFTPFYLHSDGHANSRFGTGSLSTEKPGDESPDGYVYDPRSPVPTWGGLRSRHLPSGAQDQSDIEMRSDVLVYSTPPLEKGIEVTGPLEVVLHVSSDVRDTDFTAKLIDVYPDGTAYNVQEGIQRARYREGFGKKVWMKPGEVYQVRINLGATSNYFGPGHCIRLEISTHSRRDPQGITGKRIYEGYCLSCLISLCATIHFVSS